MGIGRLHLLGAHQRADQHEQSRSRQVEIGDEAVDTVEAIARRDEDRCVALERANHPVGTGSTLDQAQTGGADRDHAPATGAHRVEPVGGGGIDASPFGVHLVVERIVGLDRKEGARPDVQRQRGVLDACLPKLRHQRGREVERRSRSRHRAFFGSEHRLIIVGILRVRRAARGDIGRQRHASGAFQQQFDRLLSSFST